MALLDLQGLQWGHGGHGGGHGGNSSLSVALCDSAASVTLCL
jgi:hypothetical protein